jgi:hypothetical protein
MQNLTNININGVNVSGQYRNGYSFGNVGYYTQNIIYKSTNNKIVIVPTDFYGEIHEMWIINSKNIKYISMFLVKNHIDIDNININTESESNNIQVIHKTSAKTIKNITNLKKNINDDILKFPFNHDAFIPKFSENHNINILIVIEPFDNSYKQIYELYVQYKTDPKYNSLRHTYDQICIGFSNSVYIKKIYTEIYDVEIGENTILNNINGLCTELLLINTDKNIVDAIDITLNTSIFLDNQIGSITEELLSIELKSINNYPMYNYSDNIQNDIYIYDPYGIIADNNGVMDRPENINLNHIHILSKIKTRIEITYIISDILKYTHTDTYLLTHYSPIEEQLPPLDVDYPMVEMDYPMIEVQPSLNINFPMVEMDYPMIEVQPPLNINFPMIEHQNYYDTYNQYDQLYDLLIIQMAQKYEMDTASPKYLIKKNVCPVSQFPIKYGNYYYKCDECKTCFNNIEIKKWFDIANPKTCPICRKIFDFYPKLYKNVIDIRHFLSTAIFPIIYSAIPILLSININVRWLTFATLMTSAVRDYKSKHIANYSTIAPIVNYLVITTIAMLPILTNGSVATGHVINALFIYGLTRSAVMTYKKTKSFKFVIGSLLVSTSIIMLIKFLHGLFLT